MLGRILDLEVWEFRDFGALGNKKLEASSELIKIEYNSFSGN